MQLFTQEAIDKCFDLIKENQETTGRGIPAPELSEKFELINGKKYAMVVSFLVETCLADKVEAKQGPGGGYMIKGMERKRVQPKIEISEEFKEMVSSTIESQLALFKGRGTNSHTLFVDLIRQDIKCDISQIEAALAMLIAEGKYSRIQGVGIHYPKNKEEEI